MRAMVLTEDRATELQSRPAPRLGLGEVVELDTALGVVAEWFRDWGGPLAEPARAVNGWYLRELPKVTDSVSIAEAEALRANAVAAA